MKDITTLLNAGRITAASLLVFGLASAGATAGPDSALHVEGYKAMSMRDDLAHRSPDINASCERVWSHIVDANNWPTWYPNSKDVQIQGGDPVLRDGTVFRWTTFGFESLQAATRCGSLDR
jgi:hypothetical protein